MGEYNAIARAKARTIISDWGIERPSDLDLHAIAAEQGLLITEKAIVGSAARLVCNDRSGLIVVNEGIREPGKKRFAAAHEIGHFTLHRERLRVKLCTEDSFLTWCLDSDLESDSNVFAAEFLMPTEIFAQAAKRKPPSFATIEVLSQEFLTSLTATAIRFVEIAGHQCALVASSDGRVKWFVVAKGFPYRLMGKGNKLDPVSCAGEFFEKGTVSTGPETVPGDAWLEDSSKGQKCTLYEDMKALTSYGTTLSLLWIQQDRNKRNDWFREYYEPSHADPEHFTPDGKRYRW